MNRIKDLREEKGWTQDELGARLTVGKGAVSRYESEKRQLDPPTINKLCDMFDCTADYLLCRSDLRHPAVSAGDEKLLEAYHSARLKDRQLIDQILAEYMPVSEEKITGS